MADTLKIACSEKHVWGTMPVSEVINWRLSRRKWVKIFRFSPLRELMSPFKFLPMLYFVIAVVLLLGAWVCAGIYTKCFSRFRHEATWSYSFLRPFCAVVSVFLYKMRVSGIGNIPSSGGCLIIANHASYVDVVCMGLACPRPIRYISWAGFEKNFWSRTLMRAMRTIPISPKRAREGMNESVEALRNGEVVCIFPEGSMTRNGSIQPFLGGFHIVSRRADVPVIPAYIDGLWSSIFSFRGGKVVLKRPQISRLPVAIEFGRPFRMGKGINDKTVQEARFAVLELGVKLFNQRDEFKRHLLDSLVDNLAGHPFRTAVVDYSLSRRQMSNVALLAAAYCLSKRFRSELDEKRIGVVLPPGIAGMAANYACMLAGKIPINLNFTLGRAQLESCLKKAEIKTIITVGAMKKQLDDKFPEFPWTEKVIDVLDDIKALKKSDLIFAILQIICLPRVLLKKLWNIPTQGGREEATILFTSGSSGMPKAAVISHRNVLANCRQIDEYEILPPGTHLLCNLPIFHCFGYTTMLWFAAARDILAVTVPSPLDYARNLQAIRAEKVTVMLSTPTFLRTYLKKAPIEYMESVRFVVAGAEKTPDGFAEAWEAKFPQSHYLEGYGMTEASPVVSVNKPDVKEGHTGLVHVGKKLGSVGILFPGMNAKVLDPENDSVARGFNTDGMLFLKGANVFEGYLDEDGIPVPATDEDGWYKSGDIVSLDERGFITIKGRLSRFSKIGGEMVPHGSVEDAIQKILCLDGEKAQIAVTGRPDAAKGECLVIVTTIESLDLQALGRKLAEAGFPNLWIPKEMKYIPEIPVLGTGKLDIKALAEVAKR